jgi:cbb3-type cytochrome oxidase subunit 3
MGMEQLVSWFLIFLAGLLTASALYTLMYVASRKGQADELDERGFVGKKRR